MSYVDGFVAAVPAANKEAYRKHASEAFAIFREFGARRMVEAWGDNVPDGKITDFKGAVKAEEGEVVVYSWIEYASKEARDAANKKMMSDPRMKNMGETMPFDGRRMIYGGFDVMVDTGSGGNMGYADGSLQPVPTANKGAYKAIADKHAAIFVEHGASRVVEAWGDDVPDGKITDYKGAVKAKSDETVVYSWVEWPSKDARDAGWEKVMADTRIHGDVMPCDMERMVLGGFTTLVDEAA
jgi:uncharacterized protein YbaA (DUF1428 family)